MHALHCTPACALACVPRRAGIFVFRDRLEDVHVGLVKLLLLDMPGACMYRCVYVYADAHTGALRASAYRYKNMNTHINVFSAGLLFFTTYTLLVLFWAEIYHQARSMPTGSLRPLFIGLNVAVYCIQVGITRCIAIVEHTSLVANVRFGSACYVTFKNARQRDSWQQACMLWCTTHDNSKAPRGIAMDIVLFLNWKKL